MPVPSPQIDFFKKYNFNRGEDSSIESADHKSIFFLIKIFKNLNIHLNHPLRSGIDASPIHAVYTELLRMEKTSGAHQVSPAYNMVKVVFIRKQNFSK